MRDSKNILQIDRKRISTTSHYRIISKKLNHLKIYVMNIIGRITKDAEVRTLKDERQFVSFSVAVNHSYRNKQGERIKLTEYFDCAYWLTTKVTKLFTKGRLIELTGWVSPKAWTSREGEIKAGLNFHVSAFNPLSAGKTNNTETGAGSTSPVNNNTEGDDLPF